MRDPAHLLDRPKGAEIVSREFHVGCGWGGLVRSGPANLAPPAHLQSLDRLSRRFSATLGHQLAGLGGKFQQVGPGGSVFQEQFAAGSQ